MLISGFFGGGSPFLAGEKWETEIAMHYARVCIYRRMLTEGDDCIGDLQFDVTGSEFKKNTLYSNAPYKIFF
jgi:hypothetical protein